MIYNLPNILTLLRIALIPVFAVLFYLPVPWAHVAVTAVFAIAAITDWLDGYLARRWQQTSAFGAFLDPVADKLMVAAALVMLVDVNPTPFADLPRSVIVPRWRCPPSARSKPVRRCWLCCCCFTVNRSAIFPPPKSVSYCCTWPPG